MDINIDDGGGNHDNASEPDGEGAVSFNGVGGVVDNGDGGGGQYVNLLLFCQKFEFFLSIWAPEMTF